MSNPYLLAKYVAFRLPTNLCIKSSCVSKGEYAVWSIDEIPLGTRFGPYEVKVPETSRNESEGLYWQMSGLFKEDWDERASNWLWLINYTCNEEQQNVIAIRHRSTVYYITSKCIPPNTELLVFCADEDVKKASLNRGVCSSNDHHKADNVEENEKKDVAEEGNECKREEMEVLKIGSFHLGFLNETDQSITESINLKPAPLFCNANYNSVINRENVPSSENKCSLNNNNKCETFEGTPFLSGGDRSTVEAHNSDSYREVYKICTESKDKAVRFQRGSKEMSAEESKLNYSDKLVIEEVHSNAESDVCGNNKNDYVENVVVDTTQCDHNSDETCNCKKQESTENVLLKPCEGVHETRHSSEIREDKHMEERLYECNVCLKRYSSKNALLVHKRVHTGEKPYQCKMCQKKFAYNHALKDHIKTHTGENLYECDLCEKKFANCTNLYRHRKIHSGVKLFECKVCQKRFYNNYELITHGRTHTGEKPYECNACPKKFIRSRDLTIHKRIHTGETPFQCDICQKSCNTKRSLMFHARVHTGEKPYECEVCQTKFAYSQGFKAHLKVHTGETPYVCNFCEKKFSSYSVLKAHKRIHTGEKPYECSICQRKFAYSSVLKGHIRTHTGEYPFSCKLCEKKFVNSSNLSRHVKIHTGERPHVCNVCEKRFTCKRYLEAHMKNHFHEKPRIYNLAYVSLIMKQIYPRLPVTDT